MCNITCVFSFILILQLFYSLFPIPSFSAEPSLESPEILVTDAGGGTYTSGKSSQTNDITYSNGSLFIAYGQTTTAGFGVYDDLRLRAWNIGTKAWDGNAVVVMKRAGAEDSYHQLPAVFARGSTLHFINPDEDSTGDSYNSYTDCSLTGTAKKIPVYQRSGLAANWASLSGWTGSTTPSSATCLIGSVENAERNPVMYDIDGLTLSNGDVLIQTESNAMTTAYTGLHRFLTRISSAGVVTGPLVAVNGIGSWTPTVSGACVGPATGANIFPKAALAERAGKTVLAWNPRKNLRCTSGCATGGVDNPGRHSADMYVATSTDYGAHLTTLAGTHSYAPGAHSAAPYYNDPYFHGFSENMDSHSDDGLELDTSGNPVFAVPYFVSGVDCAGSSDTQDGNNVYGLKMYRWTGSAWTSTVIDDCSGCTTTGDYQHRTPFLFIDSQNRYWVFRNSGIHGSTNRMSYSVSLDEGVHWSTWVPLNQNLNTGSGTDYARSKPYRDPSRKWLAFTYYNQSTYELYFKMLEFYPTSPSGVPPALPGRQ